MAFKPITADNIQTAIDVNIQDLKEQLKDCLPRSGVAQLKTDLDANGASILRAKNFGTNSAWSNLPGEVLPDLTGTVDNSAPDPAVTDLDAAGEGAGTDPVVEAGPILRANNLTNGSANTGSIVVNLVAATNDSGLSALTEQRAVFTEPPPFTLFNDASADTDIASFVTALPVFTNGFTVSWYFAFRFLNFYNDGFLFNDANKLVAGGAPQMLLKQDDNNFLFFFTEEINTDAYTVVAKIGGVDYTGHIGFEHFAYRNSYFTEQYMWHGTHSSDPYRGLPQDIPKARGDAARLVHRVSVTYDPAVAVIPQGLKMKFSVNGKEADMLLRQETSLVPVPAELAGMYIKTPNTGNQRANVLYGGFNLFDRPLDAQERIGAYFLWY